jgi:hypothetical protein
MLMLAVRPNNRSPSVTATAVSTLDTTSPGPVSDDLDGRISPQREEMARFGEEVIRARA